MRRGEECGGRPHDTPQSGRGPFYPHVYLRVTRGTRDFEVWTKPPCCWGLPGVMEPETGGAGGRGSSVSVGHSSDVFKIVTPSLANCWEPGVLQEKRRAHCYTQRHIPDLATGCASALFFNFFIIFFFLGLKLVFTL